MGGGPTTHAADPSGPQTVTGELSSAVAMLTAVLGLAAYVYLIGGIVSWVRFGAARLPSDTAVGALSSTSLFEAGFRAILFAAIAFAVVGVVAYFAVGNWDANGPDWHAMIVNKGVGEATHVIGTDTTAIEARAARRDVAFAAAREQRWSKASTIVRPTTRLAKLVERRRGQARAAREHAAAELLAKQADAGPAAFDATPKAALGDRAVRVIAGFNNIVLSAVFGLAATRVVEWLVGKWYVLLPVWFVAALGAHLVLVRWGPLRWGPRTHWLAWAVVALAAVFVSAPIGLLIIAAVAVATLGRALARVPRPASAAGLLRSPLPWAMLFFYLLAGVAEYATPPVAFPQAVVTTSAGTQVGGLLSRADGDVYLVTCIPLADATSTRERIVKIPGDEVKRLVVGGAQDWLDSGQRPSLAALATSALGLDARPPTIFRVDLRSRHATCAGAPPPALSHGVEDPALGRGVISGPPSPGGRAHDGEQPISLEPTPRRVARLARLYQPTIETTVADRFWPVSVGAVMDDVGRGGARTCLWSVATKRCEQATTTAALIPRGSQTADYLNFPARMVNDPANQFRAFMRGQDIAPGSLHHWLADPGVLDPWYTAQVYFYYGGRICWPSQATAACAGAWPKSLARDPRVPSGLIALEYWFFYPFNYYPTAINSSLMPEAPLAADGYNTDLHQGDWEHVDVLLNRSTFKPEWLYTARHDGEGEFYPWLSPSLGYDDGHVIVQAAFGGHPSYDNTCGARPRSKLYNLFADWNVCGSGRFAFRASTTPLVDLAQTRWGCWRGHFGVAGPRESPSPYEPDLVNQGRALLRTQGPPSPLWQAENGRACIQDDPASRELSAPPAMP